MIGAMLAAIATSCLIPTLAWAAQLTRWTFNPNTRRLELVVPGGTTPQYFLLAQPPRIVVDLPNTQIGNVPELSTYAGRVRSVRVGQFQPNLTRIVIELAPDVVFAPGHLEMRSSGPIANANLNANSLVAETWFIRPLLEGDTMLPPPIVNPRAAEEPSIPTPPVDLSEPPDRSAPPPTTVPDILARTRDEDSEDTLSDSLPPLEPGALEIPIELMEQAAPAVRPTLEDRQRSDRPRPNPVPPAAPIISPSPREPLSANIGDPTSPPPSPSPLLVRNAETNNGAAPNVSVIEFGQDFQTDDSPSPGILENDPAIVVAVDDRELIPKGTMLTLRYPREMAFFLTGTTSRQEVLVTTTAVRDRSGTILVPAGSLIIGRFEADGDGLRFVAQALALGDQTVTMERTTADLPDMRSIQPNQLIQVEVGRAVPR
ncbi:MAG: AMIN domain-containing protein [Leptolyngbyaceae cyanobacterium]